MFTGIIEEIGTVKETTSNHLVTRAKKVLDGIKVGESIAINGACLTLTSVDIDTFSADVMPETLRHTNLGRLHYGDRVNLERAIVAGERFGGHLVLGHVDGTGKIVSYTPEKERAVIARFSIPPELTRYIVDRGFIAVDGVSLTIIDYDNFSFSASLVTYTRQHTTLGSKKPGDVVNLEVDIVAKHIERFSQQGHRGFTSTFLKEYGFIERVRTDGPR